MSLRAIAVVGALVGAFTTSAAATPESTTAAPAPYRLRPVATKLGELTYVTAAPGDRSRLYVVARRGTVRVLRSGRLLAAPFLNISSAVSTAGERGLLSLAFHPEYRTNGLVYAFYAERDGTLKIVEFRAAGGRVDTATARVLLSVQHDLSPYHNGGQLAFGPDGALYIGIGDGGYGWGGVPDPNDNAQNTAVLLGKIVRIRPDPAEAQPELVAYGVRNPWRFSFAPNGDLVFGDVGYKSFEEIDVVPAGTARPLNFGWSVYEGRLRRRETVEPNPEGPLTWPVHTYKTNIGGNCTVIGGYVYRGSIRTLRDRYVFGDFCSGRIWSGRLTSGGLTQVRTEPVRVPQLASFGVDGSGELYAVSLAGSIQRFSSK